MEKEQKHEQAFEAPVFEKGYPSYDAVNRKEVKEYTKGTRMDDNYSYFAHIIYPDKEE